MESTHVTGQVRCEGIANPKPVRRFIEKRLRKWVELHSAAWNMVFPKFEVVVERHGPGNDIHCHMELSDGSRTWTSTQYGHGFEQAFLRTLQKLLPAQPQPARARA